MTPPQLCIPLCIPLSALRVLKRAAPLRFLVSKILVKTKNTELQTRMVKISPQGSTVYRYPQKKMEAVFYHVKTASHKEARCLLTIDEEVQFPDGTNFRTRQPHDLSVPVLSYALPHSTPQPYAAGPPRLLSAGSQTMKTMRRSWLVVVQL